MHWMEQYNINSNEVGQMRGWERQGMSAVSILSMLNNVVRTHIEHQKFPKVDYDNKISQHTSYILATLVKL